MRAKVPLSETPVTIASNVHQRFFITTAHDLSDFSLDLAAAFS
jgi:hypothetical protein